MCVCGNCGLVFLIRMTERKKFSLPCKVIRRRKKAYWQRTIGEKKKENACPYIAFSKGEQWINQSLSTGQQLFGCCLALGPSWGIIGGRSQKMRKRTVL